MKMYTGRRVVLYCAATFLVTVGALAVFRATLWPRVHGRWFGSKQVHLLEPETADLLRTKYEKIVAERNAQISPEEQKKLLKMEIVSLSVEIDKRGGILHK